MAITLVTIMIIIPLIIIIIIIITLMIIIIIQRYHQDPEPKDPRHGSRHNFLLVPFLIRFSELVNPLMLLITVQVGKLSVKVHVTIIIMIIIIMILMHTYMVIKSYLIARYWLATC